MLKNLFTEIKPKQTSENAPTWGALLGVDMDVVQVLPLAWRCPAANTLACGKQGEGKDRDLQSVFLLGCQTLLHVRLEG